MFRSTDRDQAILRALGDPLSAALLRALSGRARCIPEIEPELKFPHSSVYRRLRELKGLGLIGIQYSESAPHGGRVDFFGTLFSEIRVELRGSDLRVLLVPREEARRRLGSLVDDLSHQARGVP